jgi:hypothetical protein
MPGVMDSEEVGAGAARVARFLPRVPYTCTRLRGGEFQAVREPDGCGETHVNRTLPVVCPWSILGR